MKQGCSYIQDILRHEYFFQTNFKFFCHFGERWVIRDAIIYYRGTFNFYVLFGVSDILNIEFSSWYDFLIILWELIIK